MPIFDFIRSSVSDLLHEWSSSSRYDYSGWSRLERLAEQDDDWWIPGEPKGLFNPMKTKRGKKLKDVADLLASLGVGCHYLAPNRDELLGEIVAVTIHCESKGQRKSFDLVLDPKWRDPYR